MKKSLILGAMAACLLASGAPLAAGEFGWIATITNNSDYPVMIQNSDNGHGNSIKADTPCVAGRGGDFYTIGCSSFVIPPKKSMQTRNFVVPYESHKGMISLTIMKTDSQGKRDDVPWAIQERNSKVVMLKDGAPSGNPLQRDGHCFYTVTIQDNNRSIEMTKMDKKPTWY